MSFFTNKRKLSDNVIVSIVSNLDKNVLYGCYDEYFMSGIIGQNTIKIRSVILSETGWFVKSPNSFINHVVNEIAHRSFVSFKTKVTKSRPLSRNKKSE